VLTHVILSRIFQGARGLDTLKPDFFEDGVVGVARRRGFAGAACWVWAGDDSALHAVAALDFFAQVPGGGAARHDDFVEYPQVVALFHRANRGHWVDVEVHPNQ
jgi:hypothetical protein